MLIKNPNNVPIIALEGIVNFSKGGGREGSPGGRDFWLRWPGKLAGTWQP